MAFFESKTEKKKGKNLFKETIIKQSNISMVIMVLLTIGAVIYGLFVYKNNVERNEQTELLNSLLTYNVMFNKPTIEKYQKNLNSIWDLLDADETTSTTLKKYQEIQNTHGEYYNNLLRFFYLPSLNVWENPFTKEIDVTLMGQKYLDNDQFQDIILIQYWSDFIKNIGENFESNELTNIEIGDITEMENSTFYIPINIEFTAPNKRSFLLLVDKLSTTSNSANLSLLNEFFFYLFKDIQEHKQEEIAQLRERYKDIFPQDTSEITIIGYHIYQWIKHGEDNILVTENIINDTIKKNILCDETRQESECFYAFREKYRNLPQIAYTLGIQTRSSKLADLKNILTELPPLISITSFNFDKSKTSLSLIDKDKKYTGRFSFNAYGRTITPEEISAIAKKLGNLCFKTDEELDIALALKKVQELLNQIGHSETVNSNIISSLEELRYLLQQSETEYGRLSSYQKTIKLFEVFRMLSDANICTM